MWPRNLLDRQIEANGREAIDDYVQDLYDSAEAELESAQAEYDSLLSTEKADDVLEARGEGGGCPAEGVYCVWQWPMTFRLGRKRWKFWRLNGSHAG